MGDQRLLRKDTSKRWLPGQAGDPGRPPIAQGKARQAWNDTRAGRT